MELQENILGNLGLLASRGTAKFVKAYTKPLVSSRMEFVKLVTLPSVVNKIIRKRKQRDKYQLLAGGSGCQCCCFRGSSVFIGSTYEKHVAIWSGFAESEVALG
jgi:hypothetical protein